MLRFRPVEPLVRMTENQREIARKILLGNWGEFPRENDDENGPGIGPGNAAEMGVETATKAGLFPTPETPSRRSENVPIWTLTAKVTIEELIEITPGTFNVWMATDIEGLKTHSVHTLTHDELLKAESVAKRQQADEDELKVVAQAAKGVGVTSLEGAICGCCGQYVVAVTQAQRWRSFDPQPIRRTQPHELVLLGHTCPIAEDQPEGPYDDEDILIRMMVDEGGDNQ